MYSSFSKKITMKIVEFSKLWKARTSSKKKHYDPIAANK